MSHIFVNILNASHLFWMVFIILQGVRLHADIDMCTTSLCILNSLESIIVICTIKLIIYKTHLKSNFEGSYMKVFVSSDTFWENLLARNYGSQENRLTLTPPPAD